jgi:hypothetical protein
MISGCTRMLNYQQLYTVSLQPLLAPRIPSTSLSTPFSKRLSRLVCSVLGLQQLQLQRRINNSYGSVISTRLSCILANSLPLPNKTLSH